MAGVVDEFRSASQYTLSELFTLDDRQFAAIIPKMHDEVVIQEENGHIVGYTLEDDVGTNLLEVSDINWAVVNAFDGTSTIHSISNMVSSAHQLSPDCAFQTVKSIFFVLLKHSICTASL